MGRPKGSKTKQDEFQKLCKKHGHDPILFNIRVAQGDWEALGLDGPTITKYTKSGDSYEDDRITMDHRLNANNKLMDHMFAKKKAIELNPGDDAPVQGFVLAYNTQALQTAGAAAKKLELNRSANEQPIDVTPKPV